MNEDVSLYRDGRDTQETEMGLGGVGCVRDCFAHNTGAYALSTI